MMVQAAMNNEKGRSMTRYWLGAIVLAVGVISAFQSPINASLARRTGSVQATALSFAVGTVVLLCGAVVLTLIVKEPFFRGLGRAPWWMFLGGLLGAIFVTTQTLLVPRLGAAGLIGGIIAGLLIGSIIIDRFGLFGLARYAITAPRLVGAALLLGGAALVIRR
jgi:transporter family-2 protein